MALHGSVIAMVVKVFAIAADRKTPIVSGPLGKLSEVAQEIEALFDLSASDIPVGTSKARCTPLPTICF